VLAEDAPEVLKEEARHKQTEAEHNHATIKQETTDWGAQNGRTLANIHLAQGHLDEQIQVEGKLTQEEREKAILDSASLKDEIKTFKKESSVLRNQKQDLSQLNAAAKVEVVLVKMDVGRHNEPVWRGIESILSKDWNIKPPSFHVVTFLETNAGSSCHPQSLSLSKLRNSHCRGSKRTEEGLHEQREKSRSGGTSSQKLSCCLTGSFLF
jgi:hypothetical protein